MPVFKSRRVMAIGSVGEPLTSIPHDVYFGTVPIHGGARLVSGFFYSMLVVEFATPPNRMGWSIEDFRAFASIT